MKCLRRLLALSIILFLGGMSAYSQSQSSSDSSPATPMTASVPAASQPTSPTLSDQPSSPPSSSETPDQASDELLAYATRLDLMSSELKTLFKEAGISLTGSDASLFSSADSVQRSIDSIKSCEASIQQAQQQARQQNLDVGVWRTLGLAGLLGSVGALAYPKDPLTGASIGAGVGAVGGIAWFLLSSKLKIAIKL